VENVLASRYASQQMVDIWSAESRIILERELWVAVLKAQKELGIEIEDQVIEDYESVIESVDLIQFANVKKLLVMMLRPN
jgi:Adenylosuccinate lyase